MKQTVDILRELVSQIDTTLYVWNVEDLGNNQYKLFTKNTSYLNTSFEFEIVPNIIAKVIEFSFNCYVIIKVEGYVPTFLNYELPKPYYNHGTIRAVNVEMDEIHYSQGKYPYVFVLERMTESFNEDSDSVVDRISPINMFFLTNYNEEEWQTETQYSEIIKPMSNLREKFLSLLKNSKLVNKEQTFENEYRATNYVRFGTYSENNGNIKSLMDEDVSGVSLEINVYFNKNLNCCKNECM